MNVACSVCGIDDDLRVVPSTLFPASRFIGCANCRIEGREPRPLVVLAVLYGDSEKAKEMIRTHRYCGDRIPADEVLELIEERVRRDKALTNSH